MRDSQPCPGISPGTTSSIHPLVTQNHIGSKKEVTAALMLRLPDPLVVTSFKSSPRGNQNHIGAKRRGGGSVVIGHINRPDIWFIAAFISIPLKECGMPLLHIAELVRFQWL